MPLWQEANCVKFITQVCGIYRFTPDCHNCVSHCPPSSSSSSQSVVQTGHWLLCSIYRELRDDNTSCMGRKLGIRLPMTLDTIVITTMAKKTTILIYVWNDLRSRMSFPFQEFPVSRSVFHAHSLLGLTLRKGAETFIPLQKL